METTAVQKKTSGISGSTLKIIAIIIMLIDHFGAAVLNRGVLRTQAVTANTELYADIRQLNHVIRLIGRPAFPIFCFLLVEGFLHTRNSRKYALRLFLFALISEIPFDLAICGTLVTFSHQNVYFTLLIGLLVMMASDRLPKKNWIQLFIFALGLAAGALLRTDYGWKGVFLIEILYLLRYDRKYQCIAGAIAISWEPAGALAFLPVLAYNGERGISLKYFFYLFYPVHLLIFGLIARYAADAVTGILVAFF